MIHPYPTLNNLLDSHFNSELEGWVVGTNGTIMYTEDGGITWDMQHGNSGESFWSVFFIDESEGWTVGWSKIYHTTDKGETWEKQDRPSMFGDLTDVFFINPDTGWIVGTYNTVLKTTDGGLNWIKISNSLANEKSYYSVSFTDEMHGCAVGGMMTFEGGVISITDDGGLTWSETTPPDCSNFERVVFLSSDTGWVCGYRGELRYTIDGGSTWIDKSNIHYGSLQDIYFFTKMKGILFSHSETRLTYDGGETWDSIIHIGQNMSTNRFSSWKINEGILVGYNGKMNRTLDGGNSWENLNPDFSASICHIGFFNPTDGFAIDGYWGDGGLIRTNDGGYSWSYDTIVENGPFYKSRIVGSSCYLLNDSSQMMKTNNSGDSWELVDVPDVTTFYYDLQFVNENTGYMCGYNGVFVKTIDGGLTWTDLSFNNDLKFRSLYFYDENNGWLIDTFNKILFHTPNGGESWSTVTLGDVYVFEPQSVYFIDDNKGFATTTEGVLFMTIDGGSNWEEFYVFSYGAESKIHFMNDTEGWYKNSGGIYHTYDAGLTWTLCNINGGGSHKRSMFFLGDQGWLTGDYGFVATCSFSVDTEEVFNMPLISVFPNPVNSDLEVNLNDKSDRIVEIIMFNLKGQKVKQFTNLQGLQSFKFNVSDLNKGTYILDVGSANSENLIKVIVQ